MKQEYEAWKKNTEIAAKQRGYRIVDYDLYDSYQQHRKLTSTILDCVLVLLYVLLGFLLCLLYVVNII